MGNTGYKESESQNQRDSDAAITALQAAVRSRGSEQQVTRNSDGTNGTNGTTGSRMSGAAAHPSEVSSATSEGTGSVNAGVKASENVPVKYPEGRSPLVTAVTSERSLSYLTESPSPFSQMSMINKQQQQRVGGTASVAPVSPVPVPVGSNLKTATSNINNNNKWRDRYVMKFSGWQSSNPDAGLPPSLTSPSGAGATSTASAAVASNGPGSILIPAANMGTGGGKLPTVASGTTQRTTTYTPSTATAVASSPQQETSFNPLRTGTSSAPGLNSNRSSGSTTPKPSSLDRGGINVNEEDSSEIFVLDNDDESL
jgi:hypothetical protein